ncbi:hypothetical protein DLJ49_12215 [Rhodovulum sp. 12E13]|uniref:DUF5765 domain-containing protein n=1 Tax=Rhodovulum sp. 12E13 TaxID=2203891 RepID=UPI000E19B72D|nr:DUF5765 domain-containing protein [Rhodovulum sp. 12E13]RDC72117.1 hypothetical protein DLJ49_12215 [Rhodovulum sp. 12E13]
MCWGLAASVGMVAAGAAGTALTLRRGEHRAIPLTLGYFTLMEALQVAGYATLDQCGSPVNDAVTLASYLHIAFQPLVINAFAMAITPAAVSPALRRAVYGLAALATLSLLIRLAPAGPFGPCDPATAMCAEALCTRTGTWHIAWEVPLNAGLPGLLGLSTPNVQFPAYLAAVFLLPLAYGAWRFVLFHAAFGPVLAWLLTPDMDEMPAIWCLFSIFLLVVALSPAIRVRLLAAPQAT